MHFEPTKGNKTQADDYINKRGSFEEKGETIECKLKRVHKAGEGGTFPDFEHTKSL